MAGESSLAPLAEEIATALLGAVQRNEAFAEIAKGERGAMMINPTIRYGGWVILARGELGSVIQGQIGEQ